MMFPPPTDEQAVNECIVARFPMGKDVFSVIDELKLDKANDLRYVDSCSLHVATLLPITMHSDNNTTVMSVRNVARFMGQNSHILKEIPMFKSVQVFCAKIVDIGSLKVLSFNTLAPQSVGNLIDKHTYKIAAPGGGTTQ